jgi:poly-gamma-glutamate capsule biosynthesis protein CapA/YwtB (metallophosphatase superfamily)
VLHCLSSVVLLSLWQQPGALSPSIASRVSAPEREPLRLYAVGDLNLGRTVTWDYLLKGDTLYPFRALRDTLTSADILFGNLESPIAEVGHRYEKTGSFVFSTPPVAADALNWAGFDVVSSANNHAWDAGIDGVVETVQQLDRVGVAHVGTGVTLDLAHRAALIERKGWRVAFVGATRAFNPAPDSFYAHPGSRYVAWADSGWLYPEIRRLKASGLADIVVVSVHAGQELAEKPDKYLRRFFQGAIDAGADICLGHHPHVLQPVEWYHGKPIVYSMGNFIFRQGAPWTGLSGVFEFTVRPGGAISLAMRPVRADYQAKLVTGAAADSARRRVGLPAAGHAPISRGP